MSRNGETPVQAMLERFKQDPANIMMIATFNELFDRCDNREFRRILAQLNGVTLYFDQSAVTRITNIINHIQAAEDLEDPWKAALIWRVVDVCKSSTAGHLKSITFIRPLLGIIKRYIEVGPPADFSEIMNTAADDNDSMEDLLFGQPEILHVQKVDSMLGDQVVPDATVVLVNPEDTVVLDANRHAPNFAAYRYTTFNGWDVDPRDEVINNLTV